MEVPMQSNDIAVSVYLIPGGEGASIAIYEQLFDLLKRHEDLTLTVYRGRNKPDGQWIVALISEREPFARYQQQIQRILTEAHAESLAVPREHLVALMQRFFETRAAMAAARETFMTKHHPM